MKNIFAKYNYSFGYIKGYFALCLVPGVIGTILGLINLVSSDDKATAGTFAISGIIVSLIAIAVIYFTYRKCPQGNNSLVKLVFSMWLAGLLAAFVISWWFLKFILKLIGISFGGSGSTSSGGSYASSYDRSGETFHLWTVNGSYAILKDGSGNTVEVRPHGSDGLVTDNAGSLYYPM